jgi:Tol biopolymer transport system component
LVWSLWLAARSRGKAQPSWSHDGRWIYFFVSENKTGIWKVPAEGGTAIQLTADGGSLPQESLDAMRVFYITNLTSPKHHLRSVSVNGCDTEEYTEIGTTSGLLFIDRWTPGPNGIYFLDVSKTAASLNWLNLSTRKISRISDVSGRLTNWGSGPSLSADGNTLIFATADRMEGEADIRIWPRLTRDSVCHSQSDFFYCFDAR